MPGAEELAARRLGTVLNHKYRLERLLGEGGMAVVYLATHRNGNRVAIKILHPVFAADPALCRRFQREGYVANRVAHPGAVRVLDDDVAEDGSVFLVMELLEGETLKERARRLEGRLPGPEVVDLALELLSILVAAHEKGIVHRDIKPENLFLTRDGALKILDFGIARVAYWGEATSMSATGSGHLLGTPAFMPPEQVLARAGEIDGQTDVWAVGATMFWLLSGRYVHEADTGPAMLISAGSQPARSIASVEPGVAAPIAGVIDRALAFHKALRWPSARAMREALEAARATAYGEPAGPPPRSGREVATSATASGPGSRSAGLVFSAASPVSVARSASGRRRSRRAAWWTVSAASLVVAGASVGAVVGGRGPGGVRGDAAGLPSSSAVEPPTVVIAAPTAATVSAALTTTPESPAPDPAGPLPSASVDPRPAAASPAIEPRAAPARDAGAGAAIHVPRRVDALPASAPRATSAAAPSPAPSGRRPSGGLHPDCDPPYTVDAMGHRIPRPECL